MKLRCCECGTRFYGRSDADYCSGACRQKAYRARIRHASKDPAPRQSGDAVRRARQLRNRSHLARRKAAATLRKAAALHDSLRA